MGTDVCMFILIILLAIWILMLDRRVSFMKNYVDALTDAVFMSDEDTH